MSLPGSPPGGRRAVLTSTAGWTAVALGAVHTAVAPFDGRRTWPQAAAEGWWNTFTIATPVTPAEFERAYAFWVSIASFGVPVLLLGCSIVWAARQRHRVPGWLGWALVVWGLAMAVMSPVSPIWAVPLIGALIVLGDTGRRRADAAGGGQQGLPSASGPSGDGQ